MTVTWLRLAAVVLKAAAAIIDKLVDSKEPRVARYGSAAMMLLQDAKAFEEHLKMMKSRKSRPKPPTGK